MVVHAGMIIHRGIAGHRYIKMTVTMMSVILIGLSLTMMMRVLDLHRALRQIEATRRQSTVRKRKPGDRSNKA
ncbi:MAG: hypothetical protein ACRC9K_17565 [Afipia sp.]